MYEYDLIRYKQLYINTLFKYAKTKTYKVQGTPMDINLYLIDKRFITTRDLDRFQLCFPKCKLKHLDDYWIAIYSFGFLNSNYVFENLTQNHLIVPVEVFIKIVK